MRSPYSWPCITACWAARFARSAMCWAASLAGGSRPSAPSDTTAMVARMAMMTITTRSSMRVKPPVRCRGFTDVETRSVAAAGWGAAVAGAAVVVHVPVADVGVHAVSARLAVGAVGPDIHRAVGAGVEVLVGTTPGVHRQAVQVLLPMGRRRTGGGLLHQGFQALVGGGIDVVIEPIHLQR